MRGQMRSAGSVGCCLIKPHTEYNKWSQRVNAVPSRCANATLPVRSHCQTAIWAAKACRSSPRTVPIESIGEPPGAFMHAFATTRVLTLALLSVGLALGGCSTNPGSGPLTDDVNNHIQTDSAPAYELVPLNPATVNILHTHEPKGLAGAFTDKRPPASIVFGVGDVVSVTVFEAAAGGLFIPAEAGVRPGNFVTIPDQSVDNDGFITVPYAGQVKAAGLTAVQIQRAIVEKIANRAIEPQVVVAMSSQRTQLISVLGEVNTPARYPASAAGAKDKVLDAITRAGGIRGQGFETWVMLERGGKRATVPFENLVMTPENNIYVRPEDSIYVYREQQKFLALGATGGASNIAGVGQD